MKEKIFIFAVCVLSLSLPLSTTSAQKQVPYKLGANFELTGSAGWVGQNHLQGAQLYIEQVNGSGGIEGRPIELISYNNESNPELSSNNAKKLIERDKVTAILGTSLASTSNAALHIIQNARIVMYADSPSVQPSYPDSFFFATMVSIQNQIESVFDYFKTKGIKKVAVLCSTDSTGQAYFDVSTNLAKNNRMEFTTERFNVNDLDVTVQLTKLKAINPQALIAGVSATTAMAVVVKNFVQLGFKIPFFTSATAMDLSFLKLIADNEPDILLVPGSYFVIWRDLPDSFPQKKLIQDYSGAYQKRFKKEPEIYAAQCYDSARIMVEAIRRVKPSGQEESVKLRDAIEQIKDFPAVYGTSYTFSKEDHRGIHKDACVIIQVKGGKFIIAK